MYVYFPDIGQRCVPYAPSEMELDFKCADHLRCHGPRQVCVAKGQTIFNMYGGVFKPSNETVYSNEIHVKIN